MYLSVLPKMNWYKENLKEMRIDFPVVFQLKLWLDEYGH